MKRDRRLVCKRWQLAIRYEFNVYYLSSNLKHYYLIIGNLCSLPFSYYVRFSTICTSYAFCTHLIASCYLSLGLYPWSFYPTESYPISALSTCLIFYCSSGTCSLKMWQGSYLHFISISESRIIADFLDAFDYYRGRS